jgi:hypothetical protein
VHLVGFHYKNTVSQHIQIIQEIPNVQVILPFVYKLHFLLIKFIIYSLLIESIQKCLPHLTHEMQYTSAIKKS